MRQSRTSSSDDGISWALRGASIKPSGDVGDGKRRMAPVCSTVKCMVWELVFGKCNTVQYEAGSRHVSEKYFSTV